MTSSMDQGSDSPSHPRREVDRVERVMPIALALVGAVREGPDQIATVLEQAGKDMPAVLIALAALVPDDKTPGELLQWFHGERLTREQRLRRRQVHKLVAACGTRAGYQRHIDRCEAKCEPCKAAESDYQADRYLRRKAKQAAEQVSA